MSFVPAAQRFGFLPAGGGRLVTPLIAVMSFLTALALMGALLLGGAASELGRALERDATVQIVEANPDAAEREARAATLFLAKRADVSHIRRVPRAEAERMLQPWLGGGAGDLLPLPVMIDIQLTRGAKPEPLATALRRVAPAARLDVQARWLAPLANMLAGLSGLAGGIVAVVALATAAVAALGTRAGLGVHAPTIELLHVMGAEDPDVARVFQYRYLLHGLIGGGVGVLCALAVMAGLASGAGSLGLASPPAAAWLALALVPPAVAVLAALVARVSVARALRERL